MLKYGGNIDYFYNKFTTPKAKSMIIGDSRSMQGIQPTIINHKLKTENFELPILNYSFTIAQAPIGPLYAESILKKLDNSSKEGMFIISMTPWMLASDNNKFDNNLGEFREEGAPPHNMNFVSMNPNYEYLLKNLNYFHFKALFRQTSTMHKDGWLEEINLPDSPEVFNSWKKNQQHIFEKMIAEYVVSSLRLKSLDDLIKRLKKHGKVYIVRMPIDLDFLAMENSFYKGFDNDMKTVSKKNNILYINFNNGSANSFKTYDGHHLDKKGGAIFTEILCDSVLKYEKNL
tara:strand:- start:15164 stop:16027 length:864 start_codon:yes stop_codon:yes gene_type:complete